METRTLPERLAFKMHTVRMIWERRLLGLRWIRRRHSRVVAGTWPALRPRLRPRVQTPGVFDSGCTGPLDLHNGHVTARVERRHRSREFVALGVVYVVVASATARLSLSLNSHRWETNRLLSIGIDWLMLLNF
jgi:hypothetical protein